MEGVRCCIPKKTEIYCSNNASMESLVSQLQPYCDKILTVVNGSTIRIFTNLDSIPPGHRIAENSTPLMIGVPREFYLRDLDRDERICCFSEEVKDRFLHQPAMNDVIPKIKLPQITPAKEIVGQQRILDSNSAPLMSRFDKFPSLNKYISGEKKDGNKDGGKKDGSKDGMKKRTKVRSFETTLSRDSSSRLSYLDYFSCHDCTNRPTNNLKISDDVIDIRVPLVPAPSFSRNENI